jgi:5-formyltetrahydrofolate cyclo-ligase
MTEQGRWAGRSPAKDEVRNAIWRELEETGIAVGPTVSHIPNFTGSDMAAWRLAQTDAWKQAKAVKCNPDPPQYSLRLRALYAGKTLYCPVPELVQEFPYIRIDPARLVEQGITFELAATHQGYMLHGERIEFDDVPVLDFCVVGSVAVTRSGGRTGKGGGFADLETGIFRELGKITPDTPMATTVHSVQLVGDDAVFMLEFDSPLDLVATEAELIVTGNTMPRPSGVAWAHVQPDQYASIPFLHNLRKRLSHTLAD